MPRQTLRTLAAAALLAAPLAQAAPALTLEVYNPGERSVFPVSSELVSGRTEAVLIDAQFQRNDAEALVERIHASGKKLTTIYISHADPDFYFGLDVLHAAFPAAKIVATPQTVKAIRASKDGKLAYWGPILKENAPRTLVVPEPLSGDSLSVDGQRLEIRGLKGPAPARTFVWIPSLKAVVGGVLVYGNMHVWTADTQTPAERADWQSALADIGALRPATVVPGHFLPGSPQTMDAVRFTGDYLRALESELPKAGNADALTAAMRARYPQLQGVEDLALSAKVLKGEMTWPATH